jgi:disulfide bond formation protein DsbB
MKTPESLTTALLAAAVLVSVLACGGGTETAPSSAAVDQGRKIYSRICATCHGADANGMPALGKGLRANAFTQSLSDAELVEFLQKGRSSNHPENQTGIDMPPRGGDPSITDDELRDLVAFLRTL